MSSADARAAAIRVASVRRELVNQAHQVTGLKISEDDPLVIALMMQATYMAEAADLAAGQIETRTKQVLEEVRRLESLVGRMEAGMGDRAADINAIRQAIVGIQTDLGETPPYPGWASNLILTLAAAFSAAVMTLAAGHWLGWLR